MAQCTFRGAVPLGVTEGADLVCETREGSLDSWGVPADQYRPEERCYRPGWSLPSGTSRGPVAPAHPAGSACRLELIRWHRSNCCSAGSRSRLLGEQECSQSELRLSWSLVCAVGTAVFLSLWLRFCPVALSALVWPEIASRMRQLGAFFFVH